MAQPAERRTPLTRRPAGGLAIAGMVAAWLVLLGVLTMAIVSFLPLNPMELLVLPMLCGGARPAKRAIQQLGGGRRVRMRRHTVTTLTEAGIWSAAQDRSLVLPRPS